MFGHLWRGIFASLSSLDIHLWDFYRTRFSLV